MMRGRKPTFTPYTVPAPAPGTVVKFDYKEVETLQRYMSERGDIIPRDRSGLNAKQHRDLTRQIKRARAIALLPYVTML
jgi:small subunit ribosomal protein S18